MDLFLQLTANGLVNGTFYALSALGLTLIFGLMRVVNFAHGEFYVAGGLLGWTLTKVTGVEYLAAFVVVIAAMGLLGAIVDRFLITRVRGAGNESDILLTIGLSIFLTNTMLLIFGTAPHKVDLPVSNAPLFLGNIVVTKARIIVMVSSAVIVLATHLVIQRSRLGRAMRATFQDNLAARLVGIRTDNTYALTFGLGTALAGAAGMLLGSIYVAQVSIGEIVSLKAFVVVILGGLGSFAGAIVGGLILGIVEALWGGYIDTGFVDAIGFTLVIVMLLVRPYGLFGKSVERA